MCPNRVEELESRVQELEASVEGLTDELVECKVRLRELENAVNAELGFVPESSVDESASVETTEATESPDEAEATKPAGHDEKDNTEESESDIIIA
ncbi:hypothetical protein BRC65_01685 [Halobacteriales archaeon QH_2_65_14]|nr:MAG: hypothetical protein BRC65_01685 [Halobacteriales archaeon QH_2_65_14]